MSPEYLDPRTGQTFPLDQPRWCGPDHAPLLLTPLPGLTRAQIDTATRSLWRYRAALPMQVDDPITMGEGCTPLIRRTLHGAPALLKCEWFMPTGSFKDRGASVMLSLLRAQGVRDVLEDSSGNGGAAVSAYAAAGGHAGHDHGARLHQPGEDGADARAWRHGGADPRHAAGHRRRRGARAPRPSSTPATTGTRSSCTAPRRWPTSCGRTSASARPTTSSRRAAPGRTCSAARSAFPSCCAPARSTPCRASSPPSRRIAAPIAAAFLAGSDAPVATEISPTIAEGTAIAQPIRLREVLGALRETRGGAVMLTEAEIGAATLDLARIGIYVEPTSAQAAAAFAKLLAAGTITPEQTTVLVLTGSGLKATPRIAELLGVRAVTGSRASPCSASPSNATASPRSRPRPTSPAAR